MKKNTRNRFVIVAILLIIIVLTIAIFHNKQGIKDTIVFDAIEDIRLNKGKYDENSIVLSNTNYEEAKGIAERIGAKLRITSDGSYATLTISTDKSIEEVYQENPDLIEKFSLDYHARISDYEEDDIDKPDEGFVPSLPIYEVTDSDYNKQEYLSYLNLQKTWNTLNGQGVTVAIIDTGIDTDHSEFIGKISDWSYNASLDKIVKDYDDWSLIEDVQGHGTAVSGVIAASFDDVGVVGIAPNVNIIVIKAECDSQGRFERSSDLVFGLYYAIERGANVVNMSFSGGGPSTEEAFEAALKLAYDSDVICVASAGNDASTSIPYPAASSYCLSVGALEYNGLEKASYSNYGYGVDVFAPGTVYTTKNDGTYKQISGTSFSAPTVAAILALYLQKYPYSEYDEIYSFLNSSCYDLGEKGKDNIYGYGLIDVNALIFEDRLTLTYNFLTDEIDNIEISFVKNHYLQSFYMPERNYAIFGGWYYDPWCEEEVEWYKDLWNNNITIYSLWENESDTLPFLYRVLEDNTIEITEYIGKRKYITIPDKIDGSVVSSIGQNAFSNNYLIREVKLPKDLKKICSGAFENAINLTWPVIPDSVETIEDNAFYGCERITNVEMGINSQLKYIGAYAFGNTKIKYMNIPKEVEYFDSKACAGATNLLQYNIDESNKYYLTDDGILFNKSYTKLVAYPAGKMNLNYKIPDSVSIIDVGAFSYSYIYHINLNNVITISDECFTNSYLEEIIIPDTVESIGKLAFQYCAYLEEVELGRGLTELSDGLFIDSGLKNILIINNIERIGDNAFNASLIESIIFEENSNLNIIGTNAFAFCVNLKNITIPKSINTIPNACFYGCSALKAVNFEEGSNLININDYAFASCAELSDISLPNQLENIGDSAFSDDYKLTNISFPESINNIGEDCFKYSGLSNVIIVPKNLTNIGYGAFAFCKDLISFDVDDDNNAYCDVDGVIYSKDLSVLCVYPTGSKNTNYYLLNNTQIIARKAFMGSYFLEHIEFNNTLLEIHEEAFYSCFELDALTFPSSLMQISNNAFKYCEKMKTAIFSNDAVIPRLSYGCFSNTGLTQFRIPSSVSSIAQEVFANCNNLTQVIFASNSKIKSIASYTFYSCNELKNIIFEEGSELENLGAHAFEGIEKIESIDFSNCNLKRIGNFAFRYCPNLRSVTFKDGLEYIGRYAFYNDISLSSISLPCTVSYIGRFAFYSYEPVIELYFESDVFPNDLQENWDEGIKGYHLGVLEILENEYFKYAKLISGNVSIIEYKGNEEIVDLASLISEDIVSIGGYAFYKSNVKEVILPNTLTSIEHYAFALSKIEEINIPKNTSFIGKYAFYGSNLENITFDENAVIERIEKYVFANTKKLKDINLPSTINFIGSYAFFESAIETINLEETAITEINKSTFASSNILGISMPNTLELIDHNAFRDCSNIESVNWACEKDFMLMANVFYNSALKNLHIPNNLIYIGEFSLVGLYNLTDFTIDENHNYYKVIDGILYSKDGRTIIACPACKKGNITLPLEVERIRFGAFENSKLNSISFNPESNIITLGYRAFYNCDNIESINIPKSIISIDFYAFANSDNLKTVLFSEGNNISGIYEGAFLNCYNLSNIIIPDSILEISDYTFYGCKNLKALPFSDNSNVKGIYDYAFAYTGLHSLSIPSSVIDLGQYAFSGAKIKNASISDSNIEMLEIGMGIFFDCEDLEELSVPFIGECYKGEKEWLGYFFGAGSNDSSDVYVSKNLRKLTIKYLSNTVDTLYGVRDSLVELNVYSCPVISLDFPLLDTITIPNDATSINKTWEMEIRLIINLSDISINTTKNQNERDSFGYNTMKIIDKDGNITYGQGINDFEIIETRDGFRFYKENNSYTLIGYYGDNIIVNLPDNINGKSYSIYKLKGITDKEVIIPEGFTSIDQYAFYGVNTLKIVIASSVQEIKNYAFNLCSSKTIEFSEGSKCKSIGSYAFAEATIDLLELPESIKSIEDSAFSSASIKELQLGSNINYIGLYGFGNSNIYYSGSIDDWMNIYFSLGYPLRDINKFYINGVLAKEVTINNNIENFALSGYLGLERVIINEGVTTIGNEAFANCTNLSYIKIPSTVSSISLTAFSGCPNLEIEIDENNQYYKMIDGVIYNYDFTKLIYVTPLVTDLIIPKTVNALTSFSNNLSLVSVKFEEGSTITYLPSEMFLGCSNLCEVIIPDSVTSMGSWIFQRCYNLRKVILSKNIESIPDFCFADCKNLSNIAIPEGIKKIGWKAFSGCSVLVEITLPSTLLSIGSEAFSKCEQLYDVTNNSDISLQLGSPNNGNVAFYARILTDKNGDKTYINDNSGFEYFDTFDGFRFIKENGIYKLISYFGSEENITLPTSINDSSYVIYKLRGVINVTIPNNFTTIDEYAFYDCTSLKNITIPDSVTSIGKYAFYGCTSLTSIILPNNITNIGNDAFNKCNKLDYITIPSNVKKIENYTFANCTNLTNIIIPDGLTNIGWYAFENCKNLSDIYIPDSVLEINTGAFYNCSKLSTLRLPENVSIGSIVFDGTLIYDEQNMENGAFYYNNILLKVDPTIKYLNIKDTTTNYAKDAFANCSVLLNVNMKGNHPLVFSKESLLTTNLETLIIDELPTTHIISQYFVNRYQWFSLETLKNVVLKKGCGKMNPYMFESISGIRIFVEDSDLNLQWDKDYPGWNNGNQVYYEGEWIEAIFKNNDDSIRSIDYYSTSQIVRQPYVKDIVRDKKIDVFRGWDIDGDGLIDNVPATLDKSIDAKVVYVTYDCCEYFGHDIIHHEGKSATCTETGFNDYDTCSRCDYSTYLEVSALGHNYIFDSFEWSSDYNSCKAVYVCSNDNNHIIKYDATITSSITKNPTCLDKGVTTYKATYENHTESKDIENIDALGHDIIHHEGKSATCTETGFNDYDTCSRCDYLTYLEVSALGHNYIFDSFEWSSDYNSCKAVYVCSNDNNHIIKYDATITSSITKNPTCLDKGVTTYKATYENHTESKDIENIDALGHNYIFDSFEWSSDYNSCKAVYVCSNDNNHIIKYDAIITSSITKNPTCLDKGVTTYKATYENHTESKDIENIDALGHDIGEWVVIKEATYLEDGLEERMCSRCDEKETRIIDKLFDDKANLFIKNVNNLDLTKYENLKSLIVLYNNLLDKETTSLEIDKLIEAINNYNDKIEVINNSANTVNDITLSVFGIINNFSLLGYIWFNIVKKEEFFI